MNLSAAEVEVNIITFKHMTENTWKYEVSWQAEHDPNTKTWNKVALVPLAADIKLFRTYLIAKGNQAKELELTKNLNAFILIMETAFCRLLLLNRKRVGALQKLKLLTYKLVDGNTKPNDEGFTETVISICWKNLKGYLHGAIRKEECLLYLIEFRQA